MAIIYFFHKSNFRLGDFHMVDVVGNIPEKTLKLAFRKTKNYYWDIWVLFEYMPEDKMYLDTQWYFAIRGGYAIDEESFDKNINPLYSLYKPRGRGAFAHVEDFQCAKYDLIHAFCKEFYG